MISAQNRVTPHLILQNQQEQGTSGQSKEKSNKSMTSDSGTDSESEMAEKTPVTPKDAVKIKFNIPANQKGFLRRQTH